MAGEILSVRGGAPQVIHRQAAEGTVAIDEEAPSPTGRVASIRMRSGGR